MRHFDIIKWLWVAGIIYTFLQGYTFYMQRQGEIAVGCSFLCAFCIFQFIRRLHTLYYLHMKMKNIDKLNGRAFERYLTVQFRHLGYHVTLTSYSHDYGADLVLRKWGKKIVVQAKRYERNVGIAAVQEVVGSIAYYKADRAMVVTNSNFTKSARDLPKIPPTGFSSFQRAELRLLYEIFSAFLFFPTILLHFFWRDLWHFS